MTRTQPPSVGITQVVTPPTTPAAAATSTEPKAAVQAQYDRRDDSQRPEAPQYVASPQAVPEVPGMRLTESGSQRLPWSQETRDVVTSMFQNTERLAAVARMIEGAFA